MNIPAVQKLPLDTQVIKVEFVAEKDRGFHGPYLPTADAIQYHNNFPGKSVRLDHIRIILIIYSPDIFSKFYEFQINSISYEFTLQC